MEGRCARPLRNVYRHGGLVGQHALTHASRGGVWVWGGGRLPVIVTGAMEHWPAMGALGPQRSWSNMAYLKSVAGRRTVSAITWLHVLRTTLSSVAFARSVSC